MRSSAAGFQGWPGVASLLFILPRNHTNCFGRPFSVAPNTRCTSAPPGDLGCIVLRSDTVKDEHAWACPPDQWGRNTAKQKATANSSPENHTECRPVRSPAQGRRRDDQAGPLPPPKKTGGGRGGGQKQLTATKPPANTTRGGQTPHPEGTEDRTPKEAQGDHPAQTGNTKPGTAAHREKGHRNMQTHTTRKKNKEPVAHPSPKGDGGPGATRPRTGTPGNRHHKANKKKRKKHTRQPSEEERGTAETRAQHARPHRTPEPETAGGKRSAHETTHVP